MKPFLTVVMPVRNEARFIGDTLAQLISQEYPEDRYEILVADGMSDDGTRDIVRMFGTKHPQVRLLDNPKRLSGAGRNVGFQAGKGDYFLVVDGHCSIPDHQLFRNVAHCFERSRADCLGRPQPLDPPQLTEFQRAVALARGSKLGHGGDSLIYGDFEGYASPVSNGAAYRREVFERIGYVDESFDAAEDVEFNYRAEEAGLTCYTSPALMVRYYPRESLAGLLRQVVRYGGGRFRFLRKHPRAVTLNQLVPAAFVAGLFLLLLTALVSPAYPAGISFFGALYGVYVLLVIAESVRLAAANGVRYLRYLPLILFAVHFGFGYGFLKEAAGTLAGRNAAAGL